MVWWTAAVSLVFLAAWFCAATAASAAEAQILERRDLPGGLVRERLRLPGFDPDEAVPAIAIHPGTGGPFPVAIVLHGFRGAKENLEAWCRDLAARGIFAIAIDAHLHGERAIAGVFHGSCRSLRLGTESPRRCGRRPRSGSSATWRRGCQRPSRDEDRARLARACKARTLRF